MSAPSIVRQPRGIPVGGQFAAHDRAEADVALDDAAEESVFRRRYETADDKVKAFMAELDKARESLNTDEDWQHYLDVMSRFHRYSANNQMLIWLQRPDATQVAGFRKWQELGRQVRKGEKGISILAPRKVNIEKLDAGGNPVFDGNGKRVKEMRVVGVTTTTVFDISQTDGPDLPSNRQQLSETPPEGFQEDLESSITAAGFTVEYKDIHDGSYGYTTTDGSKRVVVKKGMSPAETVRTLAHERGHILAGHLDKMDEYHSGHGGHRGQMEVEADSIAYAVLRANGMSTDVVSASAAYTYGWATRDKDALKGTADVVSKALGEMFAGGGFRNLAV